MYKFYNFCIKADRIYSRIIECNLFVYNYYLEKNKTVMVTIEC